MIFLSFVLESPYVDTWPTTTPPLPTLPYPTLPYPTLPYPTLPYPTLPYPQPYPTLPSTLPYPLPYPQPYPYPYPTLPTWQAFLLKVNFILATGTVRVFHSEAYDHRVQCSRVGLEVKICDKPAGGIRASQGTFSS